MIRSSRCNRDSANSWLGSSSSQVAAVRGIAVAVLHDAMVHAVRHSLGGEPVLARGNGMATLGGGDRGGTAPTGG